MKKFYPNIYKILLIVAGIVLNLLFIIPSIKWGCEANICGLWMGEWHYHDALWHIAVSRVSFESFPFVYPSASGFTLTSYNYLLGLILHMLEIVKIDSFISYFYLLPIISNLLFACAIFRYLSLTKKTVSQSIWIIFFTYFCGSFSYFLIFYNQTIADYSILKGFPVATTLQPSFVLSNIQFFISLAVFVYIFTDIVTKKLDKKMMLIHAFLITISIGLKMYTSMLTLLVVFIGAAVWFAKGQKMISCMYLLSIFGFSAFAYLGFYLPYESYINGLPFAFYPLSIPHVLTESQNLFYNKEFTLGRYYMIGLNKLSPRLVMYELISAIIFVVINLGTRILFPLYFIKSRLNLENVILLAVSLTGFIIPIFYIQKSGGWYNSIQFAYLSIYTTGILSALLLDRMINAKKKALKITAILFAIVIIVLSLPNTIFTLNFLVKDKILISQSELDALSFLASQQNGIVLSLPDGKNSSYVPALSRKISYLIDDEQAALLNLPTSDRRERIDKRDCSILSEIDYIYLNNEHGQEFSRCGQVKKQFRLTYKIGGVVIFSRLQSGIQTHE